MRSVIMDQRTERQRIYVMVLRRHQGDGSALIHNLLAWRWLEYKEG